MPGCVRAASTRGNARWSFLNHLLFRFCSCGNVCCRICQGVGCCCLVDAGAFGWHVGCVSSWLVGVSRLAKLLCVKLLMLIGAMARW